MQQTIEAINENTKQLKRIADFFDKLYITDAGRLSIISLPYYVKGNKALLDRMATALEQQAAIEKKSKETVHN